MAKKLKMNKKKVHKVSIRNLVEYVLRQGDLETEYSGMDRAVEGLHAHQKIQKSMGEEYDAEVYLKKSIPYPSFDLVISGRADGIYEMDGLTVIDEIKSTYAKLDVLTEDFNPLHWAQAYCYGYLYGEEHGLEELIIQLTYVQLEHDTIKRLKQRKSLVELKALFDGYVERYGRWVEKLERWNNAKHISIEELAFPFGDFRRGQRELAVAVYKTIEQGDGKQLFARAPTGTGKTLGTLFPALKAIGKCYGEKIFYLTAKTIGREVAQKTLNILEKKQGLKLKRITLTAKDKMCFLEERNCKECPYTKDFYTKLNEAVEDILDHHDGIERECVSGYARKYNICPFEYSLSISEYCDCVICDYNYAFDPKVNLKRFFAEDASELILLVDEAHNLVERGRDMFSASLTKQPMLEMKRLLKEDEPGLSKLFGNLNKAFVEFRKTCELEEGNYKEKAYPTSFLRMVRKAHKYTEEFINDEKEWPHREALMELFFDLANFIRTSEVYDDHFITYYEKQGKDVIMKLFCLDPSKLLKYTMDMVGATIIFSATLLPMDYFVDLLGGDGESYKMIIPSPFDQHNLGLYVNDGISTKYRNRVFTNDRVAYCIHEGIRHHKGNYLVFFSSYAYMEAVQEIFVEEGYDEGVHILAQKPGMTEVEKEEFLSYFSADNKESLLAFAVMGSSFSEGIDLVGDRLKGVIIVGVGLPMVCFERNIIRDYFDKKMSRGFEYAYIFPGMNKVLQAVGRVIRQEEDRGVAILLDERFNQNTYKRLFPKEWDHHVVLHHETYLESRLKNFWNRLSISDTYDKVENEGTGL